MWSSEFTLLNVDLATTKLRVRAHIPHRTKPGSSTLKLDTRSPLEPLALTGVFLCNEHAPPDIAFCRKDKELGPLGDTKDERPGATRDQVRPGKKAEPHRGSLK